MIFFFNFLSNSFKKFIIRQLIKIKNKIILKVNCFKYIYKFVCNFYLKLYLNVKMLSS